MGALFDGYEIARRKREAMLEERHRKEEDVDRHLHALAALLDQDKAFMEQHGLSYQLAPRTLNVILNRSPVVTVHYESDHKTFRVTFMANGTDAAPATAEEAARAIGELVHDSVAAGEP